MDKSSLVKLVWLVAFGAILVAVLALQRPEVHVAPESHRVRMVDQPVAIDVTGEMRGPKPAEPIRTADPPKPRAVMLGADKIVHQGEAAKATEPAVEPPADNPVKTAARATPEAPPSPTVEAPAPAPRLR